MPRRLPILYLPNSITGFAIRYKSLSKVIKKTLSVSRHSRYLCSWFWFLFLSSGFIEDSLLYILHGAKSKRDGQGYWRDAKLLEKSMAGMGTKDAQLIYRFVFYFLFTPNTNSLSYFSTPIDLFVLTGIRIVLKLSRMHISGDLGNRLRIVWRVRRVGNIRNY